MRAAQHKIGRSLADLSAIHKKTKVIGLNVFSTSFEAMIHTVLQAHLMTMAAGSYTSLHGIFSVGCLIHGILQK